MPVLDPDDPRVADYLTLDRPARRVQLEADGGFFIVEGRLAIERLLSLDRWSIRSLLLTPAMADRLALGSTGAPVYVAGPQVLRRIVGFDLHRGAVASVARPAPADPTTLLAGARLVAVLEGVNDHENLGALFRNAAAFGIDAVLLDPTTADPLYRRAVRVSMGHVLAVPHARLPALPAGLELVAGAGLATVALAPGGCELLPSLDGATLGPAAVLLGAEGPGLSPATIAAADHRIAIAMAPGVDSLNVATAAAIAFHHLTATGPIGPRVC